MNTIILLAAGAFIAYAYFYYTGKLSVGSSSMVRENNLEDLKDLIYESIEKSHIKNYLSDEYVELESTENEFIALREKYKHDEKKRKQIEQDWYDYLLLMKKRVFEAGAMDYLDGESLDECLKEIRKVNIRMIEIGKRFEQLMGKKYIRKKAIKAGKDAYDMNWAFRDPKGYKKHKDLEKIVRK